jgi:hypothetical protein
MLKGINALLRETKLDQEPLVLTVKQVGRLVILKAGLQLRDTVCSLIELGGDVMELPLERTNLATVLGNFALHGLSVRN